MLKKSVTTVLAVIFIMGSSYLYFFSQQPEEVYIERVIDGDTVQTAAGKSIRLIGIDTPEIDWDNNQAEFYGWEARDFVKKKLLGENVLLEFDQEREDHYGRLLAYIFLDGDNFNQQLLEEGYATLMTVEPNSKYEQEFKQSSEKARLGKKGLWVKALELEAELPLISYQEAALFRGSRVIVEGEINNTAAADSINFLNFAEDYQNTLTIIIFENNLNKFAYQPVEYLRGKKIRVVGTVEFYQGSPQIIVDSSHQILVLEE